MAEEGGDWVSALAQLGAAGISAAGSLKANKKNVHLANQMQKRSFAFAREQTEKLIELANSAHQREVMDLRLAGLNPILSAGGSGAATPSLPMASGAAAHVENPLSSFASSAKSIGRLFESDYKAGVEQKHAQSKLTDSVDKGQQLENEFNRDTMGARKELEFEQLTNDYVRTMIEQKAMQHEYGISPVHGINSDGSTLFGFKVDDFDKYLDAVDLAREGLRSDLKDRANSNWRNNLGAFTGAVNSAGSAVNSVGSGAKKFRSLFK